MGKSAAGEETSVTRIPTRDPWALATVAAWCALALVVGFGAALRIFGYSWALVVDEPVRAWFAERRTATMTEVAVFFDHIGTGLLGGALIPIGLAITLLLVYRRQSAGWQVPYRTGRNPRADVIYALYLALGVIGTAVTVQVIKKLVARERPADMLVTSDFGSYPSGHSAHAAVLTICLAVILRRWWMLWIAGLYTAAMMASRVYLGAHWLTDTLAGMLIGASVAVILFAVLNRLTTRWVARSSAPNQPTGEFQKL